MSVNPNLSIGICWYSVMAAWRRGEMPIDKFIEFAAEIGADGIEVLDAFLYEPGVVRDHLPSPEAVEAFVQLAQSALDRTGIKVHAISVTNDFNFEDPHRLVVERTKIQLGIDLAQRLGAPCVRVFSGNPTTSDGVEMTRYRAIEAFKAYCGGPIRLVLENHGTTFATPSRVLSLLDPVDSPNLGVCFDIGNFLLVDFDPTAAARELPAPLLIHVKDFVKVAEGGYRSIKGQHFQGCQLGDGVVPIADTLKVLVEQLGDRAVAIDLELECGEDGVEASRHGVAWLRQAIAEY